MKVAIIGQGYVGLPIALIAAESGYSVVGFDLNPDIVSNLNSGISHIEDISNEKLKNHLNNGSYKATIKPEDLNRADIAVIAVPTPLDNMRNPDLTYIESACLLLAQNLTKETLIINESTSYPGTLRNVIAPLVNSNTDINHSFAISPERVDPGNSKWGIKNTPRLFAGLTPEASAKASDFYRTFCDNIIQVTSPEVAETAKLFENTFRQVNIALVNELAIICSKLGIDVHEVLDAADSKPYGFMKFVPGIGVGGHCIPVDPSYLAFAASKAGAKARFIQMANEVNLSMPSELILRIKKDNGGNLRGKKVVVIGISYKPNISDIRESPSLVLISLLRDEGALVSWHDPLVAEWNSEESCNLADQTFEIGVVTIIHDVMDKPALLESANYVIDCTGKIDGTIKF